MPITRDPSDFNRVVDWTNEIESIDRQFQIFDDSLFNIRGTSQTSVLFDKTDRETTLLQPVDRNSKQSTYGEDTQTSTYSLPLSYFKHSDFVTPEDVQGVRRKGLPDDVTTVDIARTEKMTDMRRKADQTQEYMKLQAGKGILKTPDGTVVADMFTEFNITQHTIDFALGTNTTEVLNKCRQLKRDLRERMGNGGSLTGGVNVYCHPDFFDKLITHETVKEAYKYYTSQQQPLRNDTSANGQLDSFFFGGINFIALDGSFKTQSGSTEQLVDTDVGHVVPTGVRDLFRGWYGPANKLSGANREGREMFMYEYNDGRDENIELQLEMAPLFMCTRPEVLIKLTTN